MKKIFSSLVHESFEIFVCSREVKGPKRSAKLLPGKVTAHPELA
jgi:hypothetical protein